VGFETKIKLEAKTFRDGSASKIGSCGDARRSTLEESVEVLLARSDCHGEDLVAVKAPKKCITHAD
jgi:hypothetical protein